MNTVKILHNNTKMIAHRGLSGIEAENTNAAFIAAGNRSYYGIETDVHKTADGQFICTHDDNAKRVCGKDLIIEDTDFDILRSIALYERGLIATRADLVMPSLAEYIRTCKRYDKIAVLELKNRFMKSDIEEICNIIIKEDYLEKVVFISFCFDNLVYLRELHGSQPAQFLTEEYDVSLPSILAEHKFELDIDYTQLTQENIRILHENGIKVNCWTCDDAAYAEKLISWGIDYITTNILE